MGSLFSMESSKPNKWREFEQLIAKLHTAFHRQGIVTHDDKLQGKSGCLRQIDITIRQKVGIYDVLIVVDCKCYKSPVDIDTLGAFWALVDDVKANIGVMVSNNGFTKGAKDLAKEKGIKLLTLKDSLSTPWYNDLKLLIEMDLWMLFPLYLKTDPPLPSYDGIKHIDSKTGEIINIVKLLEENWLKGDIPSDPGEFAYEFPFHTDVDIKGKLTMPCRLERYKFKHFVPVSFIGLFDEEKGNMFTNSAQLKDISLHDIMRNWERIDVNTATQNAIHLWGRGIITGNIKGNIFTAVIPDCKLCLKLMTDNLISVKPHTQ